MVAKFILDNTSGDFWDESFPPMPEEVLYPEDDQLEFEIKNYIKEFEKS